MPPADIRLGGLLGVGLGFPFLQLQFVKPRLEPFERDVLVLVLRTLFLREDHDARRLMHQPDGRFGSVHVLAARAGRPREGNVDIGRIDIDFDRVIDHRIDGH